MNESAPIEAAPQGAAFDPEGWVHSWEIEAGLDGPGWRFLMFLSGCPLRCIFCHNPDTWVPREGEHTTASKVLAEIGKYAPTLRRVKGGVTLSGGEPLIQPAFAAAIFKGSREMGLTNAIETSGSVSKVNPELLDLLDLCMLDIKAGTPQTYRRLTGQDIQRSRAFAREITERGIPIWLRFVLIPDITDTVAEWDGIARLAKSLPTLQRLEVLGFHQMGAQKWQDLNLDYPLADTPAADFDEVATAVEYLKSRGVPAI